MGDSPRPTQRRLTRWRTLLLPEWRIWYAQAPTPATTTRDLRALLCYDDIVSQCEDERYGARHPCTLDCPYDDSAASMSLAGESTELFYIYFFYLVVILKPRPKPSIEIPLHTFVCVS